MKIVIQQPIQERISLLNITKKKKKIHYAICIYAVFVCIGSLVVWWGPMYPFYLTTLGYYGLTAYMIGYFHFPENVRTVLYSFALTLHVLIPVIFWTVLRAAYFADPRPWSQFFTFMCHGGDFVIIMTHFFMYKNKLPSISIVWNLALLLVYTCWAWIAYAASGVFVYPFVNFQDPSAKYAYPGIILIVLVLSVFWVVVHKYRNKETYRVIV